MKTIQNFRVKLAGISLFIFVVSVALQTNAQTKQIKKPAAVKTVEKNKRTPTSAECPNTIQAVQQNYLREFDLKKSESQNIYVTYERFADAQFAKATHPDNCSAKGCAATLNLVRSGECPKVVLLYNGVLKFVGPATKKYQKVEVKYRGDATEGGELTQTFEFNEKEQNYRDTTKK